MALPRPLTSLENTDPSVHDEHSSNSEHTFPSYDSSLPLPRPKPAARPGQLRPFKQYSRHSDQFDETASNRNQGALSAVATGLPSKPHGQLNSGFGVSTPSTSSSLEVQDHYHNCRKNVNGFNGSDHADTQFRRHHSFKIYLYSLWNLLTPTGIFLTIYFCNIVGWGGMAFLLIINVAPAMCHPDCGALGSSREDWIEIDSRITVLLLAVTALGLSPWRLRDLYYLLTFRMRYQEEGLKRLEKIHKAWLHFPSSSDKHSKQTSDTELDIYSIPYDTTKVVLTPPHRLGREAIARPTKLWKLEVVTYLSIANVIFHSMLTGVMWGLNQYDRPSWAPAVFVSLALGTMAAAGLMRFIEKRRSRTSETLYKADSAELLTDEEARAAIKARRRYAWTLKCYRKRWEEEKRNWIVVRA